MSFGPTGPKGGFGAQGFRGEKGSIGPTGPSIDPAIINSKAPLNNPKFTGTVEGVTKAMVGLGNVDNTSDLNKEISSKTQSALNLKAPINNPIFTGTVGGLNKSMVELGNVDNTSDLNKEISTKTQTALNLKADITYVDTKISTFTGSSTISTATHAALNLKAPLANPQFTTDILMGGIRFGTGNNNFNIAIGGSTASLTALGNNGSGYSNVAIGYQSLQYNQSGTSNCSFGDGALRYNNAGHGNSAFGHSSGSTNNYGSNNTFIGSRSNCSTNSLSNSTAIGSGANITKSQQIVLGSVSVTEVTIPSTVAKLFVGTRDVIASIDSKAEFYIATANYTLPTPTMNKMLDVVNTSSGVIIITYGTSTKALS